MHRTDDNHAKQGFYGRWAKWILAGVLVVAPMIFFGAAKALQSNVNKVEDWLPQSFAETQELKWFRQNFPTDQFILVSWQGCKLGDGVDTPDDPRIEALTKLLEGELDTASLQPPPAATADLPPEDRTVEPAEVERFVKSVTSGRETLNELMSPPMNIPRSEAIDRLQGSLIGPDGRQTCLVVSLTPEAISNLKSVMGHGARRLLKMRDDVPAGFIHRAVAAVGIPADEVHYGGPPVDNIAIDEEGERTLVRLAGVSGLLGLALAYWSLRSVKLTLVVFACGVLSAAASLAFIWVTGETLDAVVMSMPSLVYVLSISGAVHLINYYRDAVLEGGMHRATERAAWHALKPAALCSVTTSLGLASLYASDLTPIRKFGVYAAAGVMILNLVLFLYVPSALQVWQYGRRWLGERPAEDVPPEERRNSLAERTWAAIARFIVKHHWGFATGTILVTAAVGWGVTRTRTSINLLELFDSRARILQDYRWLEDNIGQLVPMEIVVKFDRASQSSGDRNADSEAEELFRLTFLERLETVALIQETIERKFGKPGSDVVGRSLSAATFAPSLPSGTGGMGSFIQRKAYDTRLSESRDAFIESGFLRVDPADDSELWRVSLRVAAFKGIDYGQFVHELQKEIEPITEAHDHRLQILRHLAANDEDGSYAASNVYIWDQRYTDPERQRRHESMVSALEALLAKARIRTASLRWDPSTMPEVKLAQLNRGDAVVLAGPFADQEARMIAWALDPGRLIDLKVGVASQASVSELAAGAEAAAAGNQAWLSAVYTGVVPIVYKAQRELLQSLVESTFWSFATITPLMMLVSRSFRAGAVAMIPNVMPILIVFGAMGWLGISIDIGSMMSASIALGVAVDDTIHFLAWYREDLNRMQDRRGAIISCYRRCATPTLQAAMISGLGLSVFAFSTFTPTQRFGYLMLTILIAGVISELVLLPSILAGPLGKVFQPRDRERPRQRWWQIARHRLGKGDEAAADERVHHHAA